VRKLFRLAVLVGLTVWAWRVLVARRGSHERAGVSYADGSSVVLEPGSPGFDALAGAARGALASPAPSGSSAPS
jgi:hypothetical protein